MKTWLTRWFGSSAPDRSVPFSLEAMARPDAQVEALFRASFRSAPPDFPLHYVARWKHDGSVRGYVHYTQAEPGVYLCGGLCVDTTPYRRLSDHERMALREAGSLSRWILRESIGRLESKRAVFAYTGHTVSLRDCEALGFVTAVKPYLIVQWHAGAALHASLIQRIAALGPF